MSSSPFTPSRSSLGDISNNKFLRSTLKTPLSTVHEVYEPIEASIGEVLKPVISEGCLYRIDYSNDMLCEYPDYNLSSELIDPIEDIWEDPEFMATEIEILKYLDLQGPSSPK